MKNARWEWVPLGDLFEIGAGKTMSRAAREGHGRIPFLRTSNVLWDEIDLSQLDEMALSPEELREKCVARGDLLVCEGGDIGRAAVWNGVISPLAFQNHLHRLRPRKQGVFPRFYVYFLQSAFTQLGLFEGAGNETTIPNLSRNRLASLEVPYPSQAEQEAITQTLALVRGAADGHTRAAAHAEELKGSVMRQIFTHGIKEEPPKDTEIGLIPESWNVESIGNLFLIDQGISLKRNLSRDHSGVPFLRTSNVYWGRTELGSVSRMHIEPTLLAERTLAKSDLLVCEGGEIGRAAVWNGSPEPFTFQNHLHRLRPLNGDRINPEFAAAWLEVGFRHRRVYQGAENKTTIPNLSRNRLAELHMPVPSILEQHKIVEVLKAIQCKVDLHSRKRSLLEELFQSLLRMLITGSLQVSQLDLSALPAPAETNL